MTKKTDYRAREYAKRVETLQRRKARAEKYGEPITKRAKAGTH